MQSDLNPNGMVPTRLAAVHLGFVCALPRSGWVFFLVLRIAVVLLLFASKRKICKKVNLIGLETNKAVSNEASRFQRIRFFYESLAKIS